MAAKKKPADRGCGGGLREQVRAGKLNDPKNTPKANRSASFFALIGPDLVVVAVAASLSSLEARR